MLRDDKKMMILSKQTHSRLRIFNFKMRQGSLDSSVAFLLDFYFESRRKAKEEAQRTQQTTEESPHY